MKKSYIIYVLKSFKNRKKVSLNLNSQKHSVYNPLSIIRRVTLAKKTYFSPSPIGISIYKISTSNIKN